MFHLERQGRLLTAAAAAAAAHLVLAAAAAGPETARAMDPVGRAVQITQMGLTVALEAAVLPQLPAQVAAGSSEPMVAAGQVGQGTFITLAVAITTVAVAAAGRLAL